MFVVTGVTGHTGKVVAEALIARGESVRVVVRDAAKGEAWRARGAEVAVADLQDAAALARAFAGARGVYTLVPPNLAAPDFRAYQRAVGAALSEAVRAAKVPHVVLLSSVGAELAEGTGPIAGLHDAEAALSSIAGTHATFLRAGWFAENLGGSLGALPHGILPSFFPADFPIAAATTKDIGELAATLLVEGASTPSVVQLGGPDLTMDGVADAIGRITGKRPQVVVNDAHGMAQALQGFGVPPQMARLYQQMTLAILAGTIRFHDHLRRVTCKTSVEDVLRGLLAA